MGDILRATVTRHLTEGCWASLFSGAHNDGFLLNTLKHFLGYPEYFWISRNAFYKICLCSVILGELESVRNYKG